MQRGQVAPVTTLALAATLALGAVVAVPEAKAATADDARKPASTFAVIGDVPYGTAAEEHFPTFVQGINADPDVTMVTHLGDIKSGSTTCTDERFERVRHDFDGFADPLVYTPGDNEWTDCHRPNNGGYQPLERLAKVRSLFFSQPGTTLGHFLVLHAIGSGGMGVVYAAQQDRPRRTVAIKVLRRGFRHSEILRRFEAAGLRIAAGKLLRLTPERAQAFYAVHKERPFFAGLCTYMSSGPIFVSVLQGENAILKNREIMGATDPAKAAPGTIRKDCGRDVEQNAVHGSDSPETAAGEIAFFFKPDEVL